MERDQIIDKDGNIVNVKFDEEQEKLDDLSELEWDGPEDSDEEIESLAKLKTDWEIQNNVKFSKNGIISYIESFIEQESSQNNKKWEQKLKTN